MADSDTDVFGSSSFYKEIIQLPVIKSAEELYRCTKGSSRVLNTGLTVLEYSVSTVLDKVFTGSNIAIRVDSMVGKGVSKLKEKYPALQTSPKEIREGTLHSVQATVRSVMKTRPGQAVLLGLDLALDTSESILKRIKPRDRRLRRRKTTKSRLQKEEVNKDQFRMSEVSSMESSVCNTKDDPIQGGRCQQTFLQVKHEEPYAIVSVLERAYRRSIVYPLEVLVKVLRALRQFAKELEWTVEAFTTEMENRARRKISPSKSVSFSFLGVVKQETDSLLEYKHNSSAVHREDGSDGSRDRDEGEKKRKHDESLTDEGSEAEEDIANFDIDNNDSDTEEDIAHFDFDSFDSENDPDYVPNSAEASSQSDTEEEVSASDAESEFVNIDSHLDLVHLKDENDLKSGSVRRPSESLEGSSGSETTPRPSENLESSSGSETTPRPSENLDDSSGSETTPRPSEKLEDSSGSETTPRPSENLRGASGSETTPRPSENLRGASGSEAVRRPSENLECSSGSETTPRPTKDESETLPRPSEDLDSSGTPVDNQNYSLLKRLSQTSPTKLVRESLKNVYHVCI